MLLIYVYTHERLSHHLHNNLLFYTLLFFYESKIPKQKKEARYSCSFFMNQNACVLLLYSFLVRFTKQTSEPRNENVYIYSETTNYLRPYEFLYYSHVSEAVERKNVYTRQHAISRAFFSLLLQHSASTLISTIT